MFSSLKVVLLANTDWYLANFRFDLACSLRDKGAEAHCIAPPGKYLDWLSEQGFQTHALQLGNKSYSPLDNWKTLQHLKKTLPADQSRSGPPFHPALCGFRFNGST